MCRVNQAAALNRHDRCVLLLALQLPNFRLAAGRLAIGCDIRGYLGAREQEAWPPFSYATAPQTTEKRAPWLRLSASAGRDTWSPSDCTKSNCGPIKTDASRRGRAFVSIRCRLADPCAARLITRIHHRVRGRSGRGSVFIFRQFPGLDKEKTERKEEGNNLIC